MGLQENALELGKVAGYVESLRKQSLATVFIEKIVNLTYSVKRTKGPKTDLPPCK